MSNDTNREGLLKIANLVRPALASQAYIPALTHIRFDGKMATAYNDIAAISVRCDLDASRLIPGELLIRALGSFNGESIALQEDKDGAIVVKSGRSKVKLPTLDVEKFPLELPDGKAPEIEIDADIRKGLQRCLLSVSNDPTHPAGLGVTLDADERGKAVLFSTDNVTISRYGTKSKVKLPGDAPVMLPTFFCEQLLKLASAFPDEEIALLLYDGGIVAEFGKEAVLFTKTLVDLQPFDYPRIIGKHCDIDSLEKQLAEIPAGFDEALSRALLVLSSEADKATRIDQEGDYLTLSSESELGAADDRFKFEHDDAPGFHVDPAHLARAGKVCTKMAFLPRVLVMADESLQFTHIVSHVDVKSKK